MPQRVVGSYSFFSELENCPFKAYNVRIARTIQRVETAEQRWGNYVHESMDKRVGNGEVLPEELAHLEPYAMVFDGKPVKTEQKMCITAKGMPHKWYGPEAFVAGKIDVVYTHRLNEVDFTDWKTGKDKYETPFELELHALLHAAAVAPVRPKYTGRYVYIGRQNLPDKVGPTYDLSDIEATWSKVVRLMREAYDYEARGEWPKKPNALCGWCAVTQCPHNKVAERKRKEEGK